MAPAALDEEDRRAGGARLRPPAPLTATAAAPADERRARLALALLPGVGPARLGELLRAHGSAPAALAALGPAARDAALARANALHRDAVAVGATVRLAGEADFPRGLAELESPPTHLLSLGAWPPPAPAVAVVGTRQASAYGERVTRELVRALARAGVAVVSGLARGIDAAAHAAALEHGAATVAVLGTGIDVPYPASHAALHAAIARTGTVVSEHEPGRRAAPGCFPRRNRIIAALAEVTLVVEAGQRSGALITAAHALELGRAVAAVPGPIDAPQSRGANELLRDGAQVVASPDDLLALLGRSVATPAAPELDDDERRVWGSLAGRPLDLDALTAISGLPVQHCLAAVTRLELRGIVECALTGEIRRRG